MDVSCVYSVLRAIGLCPAEGADPGGLVPTEPRRTQAGHADCGGTHTPRSPQVSGQDVNGWLRTSKLSEPSSIDMQADGYTSGSAPRPCNSACGELTRRLVCSPTRNLGGRLWDLYQRSL